MMLIENILQPANNKRKEIRNNSKEIDRKEEYKITTHKYGLNKILSGNKEVEEYNISIEKLKESYEERIVGNEEINKKTEENLKNQLEQYKTENAYISKTIEELQRHNFELNNNLRMVESRKSEYPNFDVVFENKNIFINYLESFAVGSYKDNLVVGLLKEIIDKNLQSLICKLSDAINNHEEYIKLSFRSRYYNEEKHFLLFNNLGEVDNSYHNNDELRIEVYFIGKSFNLIKEMTEILEGFDPRNN